MADLSALLNTAAEEVLENMFFSGVTGELPGEPGGDRLSATVSFVGSSEGELTVSATASALSALAAGFLGEEDDAVSEAQLQSVAGELANVLCGAVLGHLNPKGSFRIAPPRIAREQDGNAIREMEVRKLFELLEGDLAVGLTVH